MHPGNAGALAQPRPDRLGDGTGREFVTFKLTQIGFDHWAACMRDWSAEVWGAYPDPHFDLEEMIAEGDRVVTRVVWTGTHKGEFWGVAPTGQGITVNAMFIHRVVDGRISWEGRFGVVDLLSWYQQLGLAHSATPALRQSLPGMT